MLLFTVAFHFTDFFLRWIQTEWTKVWVTACYMVRKGVYRIRSALVSYPPGFIKFSYWLSGTIIFVFACLYFTIHYNLKEKLFIQNLQVVGLSLCCSLFRMTFFWIILRKFSTPYFYCVYSYQRKPFNKTP